MNYIYELEMKVRDYECDLQGIVNNANYQHYFEVTRHELLEKVGLNFYDLHQQGIDAIAGKRGVQHSGIQIAGHGHVGRRSNLRIAGHHDLAVGLDS